jgi:hypothetical protein
MIYDNDFFDLIIDKGCLDSIFCAENSFEISKKAINEIHRVLKSGGLYIMISNSTKEHRIPFL